MEAGVLHRVGCLEYFCPKQGQDFKPSAAPIYPNMGKVPPFLRDSTVPRSLSISSSWIKKVPLIYNSETRNKREKAKNLHSNNKK